MITTQGVVQKKWSDFEDKTLLEVWARMISRSAKVAEFNRLTETCRTETSLEGRFNRLSKRGPEVRVHRHNAHYSEEEEETLREIWNDPSVKPEDRAVHYNAIEKPRTEYGLHKHYALMVKSGKAPSNKQLELNPRFREIWTDHLLTLEERTKRINSHFGLSDTTGDHAARYHNFMQEDPKRRLVLTTTGDDPDCDGPWKAREVRLLVDMWQTPPSEQPFSSKALAMMGLDGSERSLSSMENKWQTVTGLCQYTQAELQQEQQTLDAQSKIRNNDGAWTRLEDNILRFVCLLPENKHADWSEIYVDWIELMGMKDSRDPMQIARRWDDLRVTPDPLTSVPPLDIDPVRGD